MELTAEQITELGLTEEIVPKISSFLDEQIAVVKQEFAGKANTDAEAILTGASKKILDDTKIERKQGEKVGDYFTRAWEEFNTGKLTEVGQAKAEYEKKLKEFKGNDDLISKITNLETEKDTLLQKFANFDEIKEKAEKYEPLKDEYEKNKIQVAFANVKPHFPDTVNKYEADAKWDAFKRKILEDNTIEYVDGELKAVNKANTYESKRLSDLVSKDDALTKLTQGRQQTGTGGKEIPKIEVEGVPFPVPENIDSITKTQLIKDYLTKTKGLNPMSREYSVEFAKYNTLINNKKKV